MIYSYAFDVDGCLIDSHDKPRHEIISILVALHKAGHRITVWSGGGKDYASLIVERLGLWGCVHEVRSKTDHHKFLIPDVCFDDQEVQLGRVNIRV